MNLLLIYGVTSYHYVVDPIKLRIFEDGTSIIDIGSDGSEFLSYDRTDDFIRNNMKMVKFHWGL